MAVANSTSTTITIGRETEIKSHSDKVIALDMAMWEMHNEILQKGLDNPEWRKVQRLLAALFEGTEGR